MKFEDLVGNDKVKNMLKNSINENNILHSYMFVGTEGIGKAMFAKTFANMLFVFLMRKNHVGIVSHV